MENKMPRVVQGTATGSIYHKTKNGVSPEAAWYSNGVIEVVFVGDDLIGDKKRKPVITEVKT